MSGIEGNQGTPPPPLPPLLPESPPLPPKPWGFWATLAFSIVITFSGLMTQGAVLMGYMIATDNRAADVNAIAGNGLVLSLATLLSTPVVVSLCFVFAWIRKRYSIREYLGLIWPGKGVVLKWLAALIGYVLLADGLTYLLGRAIIPEFMIHAIETAGFLPLLWVAIIVAAPLGEETFFRGFLFKGLQESSLGPWAAVVLTSLIWSLIHQQYNWYQMAWIFSAGLLLGAARVRTGSLLLCIFLHACMNLIATIETIIYLALRKS